jgi:hypothetical protein
VEGGCGGGRGVGGGWEGGGVGCVEIHKFQDLMPAHPHPSADTTTYPTVPSATTPSISEVPNAAATFAPTVHPGCAAAPKSHDKTSATGSKRRAAPPRAR